MGVHIEKIVERTNMVTLHIMQKNKNSGNHAERYEGILWRFPTDFARSHNMQKLKKRKIRPKGSA